MAEIKVTCQISCQKCGWKTGATLLTDEANVLDLVLKFIKGCSPQHSSSELSGKLLVVWNPSESQGH